MATASRLIDELVGHGWLRRETAPLKSYTVHTVSEPARLRRLLADVRRDGFAFCPGFVNEEATGIAVPLRGAGKQVVAALSVIVPNDDNARMQIPALQAAALGITRAMGTAGE